MISSLIKTQSQESLKKDYITPALQVLAGSLFIALTAQITIPLYFSPVPLSGQTFGVMMVGAVLGSRKGALSVLAYLLEAMMGLPVLAGGSFGLAAMLGTNAGYLIGFVLQAYLIGKFTERQTTVNGLKTMAVCLASCAVQLTLGALWLSQMVGVQSALVMGVYPFILGEFIKSLCLVAYLKTERK